MSPYCGPTVIGSAATATHRSRWTCVVQSETPSNKENSVVQGIFARVVIDLDVPGPTISRHLYGHFAEHLGRCIYGGFWVGEDSADPERGRHPPRRRRGAAGAEHPQPALAGRLLRRRVPLEGRHRPAASQRPPDGQHPLGRRRGEQPLRHPRVHGAVRAARRRAVHQRQRRQRHRPGDERVGRVPHPRRRQPDGRGCARRTAATSRGRCRSGASATRPGAAAATCAPSTTPTWPASTPPTAATTATTSSTASPRARPTTTTTGPRR